MKNPATQPGISLRLLRTTKLPVLGGEPGPIHTILQDESGNIYYSDEINHSLVSLNAAGEVRWHQSRKGNKLGELHYPKGIELGWIAASKGKARCLAVCDSWNRRIQFLDRDGNYLTAWDRAGDVTFGNVVDIRFISTDDAEFGSPCWLVLDGGLHCLFGFDPAGFLIFRSGRPFPENLESHWPVPCESPEPQMSATQRIMKCLPYDPLFMPLRIFGNAQEGLFIWEPGSRRLKLAASGNFLPIWMERPEGADWIGADVQGLLYFDKSAGLLGSFDSKTKTWRAAPIEGMPIPSGRSSREVWFQNGALVHHWDCCLEQRDGRSARSWALSNLPDEVERILYEQITSTELRQLQETAAHLRDLGKKALQVPADQWTGPAFVQEARSSLTSLINAFGADLSKMRGFAYSVFLAFLKLQLLRSSNSDPGGRQSRQEVQDRIQGVAQPVEELFQEMLLFRDDWFLARLGGLASGKAPPSETQEFFLQEFYDSLMSVLRELAKWLFALPFFDRMNNPPETHYHGHCFTKIIPQSSPNPESRYLREIDRIFIGGAADGGCVSPTALCFSPGIGFLVTLNRSGRILRLSEHGEVHGFASLPSATDISLAHAHGIAVDDADHIWISSPQQNSIKILNTSTNQIESLEDLAGRRLGLKHPTGIYKSFNGQMLIADTQNSRILAATKNGEVTPFLAREGRNPGELRHPIAFCAAKDRPEFWVVEIRNHRLQRFGLQGQSLGEIGGPGLGKGRFVMPESAAIFDDGMLAVTQRQCTREIKLFATDGSELEALQLDYSPYGIWAHKNLLLVCEAIGNHIRVYERV